MSDLFIRQAVRPLPVILLLDTSGSMYGEKIDALNLAVKKMIESFGKEDSTISEIYTAIITFGGRVNLHTDITPSRLIQFENLDANGMTPMGGALKLCAELINDKERWPKRSFRPTVVLVSDGEPNDDYKEILTKFVTEGRTAQCDRWALAIGNDADHSLLEKFLTGQEKRVMEASDAAGIAKFFATVTNTTKMRSKEKDPNKIIVPVLNDILPLDNGGSNRTGDDSSPSPYF
ncbi:vWA domain-containing protein [Ectobacillus funiculus]|uniref:vWA domain-containing protein n=1 Tax=Ectobacillus funiculus TaxID=137993 RepID=UPI00101E1E4A|nr:VWA domain-containing protein [Ectobacillus funiculus]